MKNRLEYIEGKSYVSLAGYAFIDECGGCIIIVYGEGRRDAMAKYLNEDGDMLKIKYKIVTFNKRRNGKNDRKRRITTV